MLNIGDFKRDRAIFEVRYPKNLLFWDRVGQVWDKVAEIFPDEIPTLVDPNRTQFEAGSFLLYVDNDQLRSTAKDDVTNRVFTKSTSDFMRAVINVLGISVYQRIGFRQIWTKEYKTIEETVDAYESVKISKSCSDIFSVNKRASAYNTLVQWEGKTLGASLSVRTERRKQEVQVPWEVRSLVKVESLEKFYLVIDVDYFTTVTLNNEQFNAGEWIRSAHKQVSEKVDSEVL